MKYHPVYGFSALEKGWVPAPRYLLRRNRILKIFTSFKRGRILEVGSGAGALLNDLSRLGFSCAAVETSPEAYELAAYINRDNMDVKIYREVQSGWQSGFDVCMALEVLEHIEDDQEALKQWAAFIKPGGRLILSVPAHQKRWSDRDVWAGHFRRYERDGLKKLLEKTGFSIDHIESYGFPLANIIEPIRIYFTSKKLNKNSAINGKSKTKASHTARSGVERPLETRLFRLQASWIGTKIMQASFLLQGLFAGTDLGNGYIVVARRR